MIITSCPGMLLSRLSCRSSEKLLLKLAALISGFGAAALDLQGSKCVRRTARTSIYQDALCKGG